MTTGNVKGMKVIKMELGRAGCVRKKTPGRDSEGLSMRSKWIP